MKKKALSYFQKLISTNNTADAKIFITLLMALHFILTAFMFTFLIVGLALFAAKGSINKDLIDLMDSILKNDMVIIGSGLGFISLDLAGQMWVERVKAKAQGPGDVTVEDGGKVVQAEKANIENAETVNSKNTSIEKVT